MLLNSLYTIQSVSEKEEGILAEVWLRQDHALFAGHFPGQPVLPGVCMMEMITEISGEQLHKNFRIAGAPLVKFLHMIDPRTNSRLSIEISWRVEENATHVNGKIFSAGDTFMKFQLVLVSIPH